MKPPRLRKGDRIALISPASTPSSQEKIDGAVRYLENRGYNVVVGKHAMNVRGYLAGSDAERVSDLNTFIRDGRVRAIIAIRGGYGTPRILGDVDYEALKKDPKVIVGYSDMTGLQLAILARTGLITFSGPMAGVEMWKDIDPYTEENFWRVVERAEPPGRLENPDDNPVKVLKEGTGEGVLVGGNFSLMNNLLGTPFMPPTAGIVLALEDVDEAPHRIDRMLAGLKNAGIFRNASAILFGQFTDCVPTDPSRPHLTVEQAVLDYAPMIDGPVLSNIQFGHIPKKLTLPLGARVHIDGRTGSIRIPDAVVS